MIQVSWPMQELDILVALHTRVDQVESLKEEARNCAEGGFHDFQEISLVAGLTEPGEVSP